MSKFKRIGIMGGTFDPIHFGHLVAAEAARDSFELERVFFVPSGNPPHKKDYLVTDAEHRYLMTNLAVAANPFFEVSSVEIERKGYSYSIDTVTEFYNKYKDHAELYFITGADAVLEILTWKNSSRFYHICNVQNLSSRCHLSFPSRMISNSF
jgi:nicotinate-nucleotide adenylyltransferase